MRSSSSALMAHAAASKASHGLRAHFTTGDSFLEDIGTSDAQAGDDASPPGSSTRMEKPTPAVLERGAATAADEGSGWATDFSGSSVISDAPRRPESQTAHWHKGISRYETAQEDGAARGARLPYHGRAAQRFLVSGFIPWDGCRRTRPSHAVTIHGLQGSIPNRPQTGWGRVYRRSKQHSLRAIACRASFVELRLYNINSVIPRKPSVAAD